MATVQRGVFTKQPLSHSEGTERPSSKIIHIDCQEVSAKSRIQLLENPTRWHHQTVPLENARVIVAGGRGMKSKQNFSLLHDLAELLGGEVGSTRVPVFNKWCEEERMIGQTGKTVKPDLYLACGISGQIQHTGSLLDAKRIIAINTDATAPIHEISDYFIMEDATLFLKRLIEQIKREKKATQCS